MRTGWARRWPLHLAWSTVAALALLVSCTMAIAMLVQDAIDEPSPTARLQVSRTQPVVSELPGETVSGVPESAGRFVVPAVGIDTELASVKVSAVIEPNDDVRAFVVEGVELPAAYVLLHSSRNPEGAAVGNALLDRTHTSNTALDVGDIVYFDGQAFALSASLIVPKQDLAERAEVWATEAELVVITCDQDLDAGQSSRNLVLFFDQVG